MGSQGQRGLEAVRNKKWAAAIPLLDKALESSNSPAWLLARSQAHQMLNNPEAALEDAEAAYDFAVARGSGNSRKLMIDAQYRRACALLKLGRHADADCCARWSMQLAEGRPASGADDVQKSVDEEGRYTVTLAEAIADKAGQPGGSKDGTSLQATNVMSLNSQNTGYVAEWNRAYVYRSQIVAAMEKLPVDHPGRKVTVAKVPLKRAQQKVTKKEKKVEAKGEAVKAATGPQEKNKKLSDSPVPIEKLKLRADFYQSLHNVTVSLFVKDVKRDGLSVTFEKNRVIIGPIPREADPSIQRGDPKSFSTLILANEIDTSRSKYSVSSRKIELILKKRTPGTKWDSWGEEKIGRLESTDDKEPKPTEATPREFRPKPSEENAQSMAPTASTVKPATVTAYPTSSKTGPKDWDRLEVEGDAEDESKADVNHFFKQLYKGSTPDQQRAMMKSFVESNGTALSTDWNDVGSRKVETVPPEGAEAKKW